MIGKLSGNFTTKYMKKLPSKPLLSIVIVSYNTKKILRDCLRSLEKVASELNFEVMVSDNGSSDGSVDMLKEQFSWVSLIENRENLGFAKANNQARSLVKGRYVLFLNSDTLMKEGTLKACVSYMEEHRDVGSMTCKIVLPSGELDKDTRRSLPTPYVALTHFMGLDRLFPGSKIFAKYWYGYISEDAIHEADVIQGAFHLSRKEVLNEAGWFDEDYFLDGEDIDLCYRIKKLGYRIVYYPRVSIVHIKKASKKKHKSSLRVSSGVKAMEIFYKKRLWDKYPLIINYTVIVAIKILLILRLLKHRLGS